MRTSETVSELTLKQFKPNTQITQQFSILNLPRANTQNVVVVIDCLFAFIVVNFGPLPQPF